jgi:hypothetical protein
MRIKNGGHRERGEALRHPPVHARLSTGNRSAAGRSVATEVRRRSSVSSAALKQFDDVTFKIIQTLMEGHSAKINAT